MKMKRSEMAALAGVMAIGSIVGAGGWDGIKSGAKWANKKIKAWRNKGKKKPAAKKRAA